MKYLLTLLALLAFPLALGQEEVEEPIIIFGVRFSAEMPVDGSIVGFVANPIGYAASNADTVGVAGFIERGPVGMEVTFRSGREVSGALYYVTGTGLLFGIGQETNIGLRVGHRAGEFFARLQFVAQIHGVIKPP